MAGINIHLGHQVLGVIQQLAHGYLRQEGGVLDNRNNLTHHSGDDSTEALRDDDIPKRADEIEALRGGSLKLAFGNRI